MGEFPPTALRPAFCPFCVFEHRRTPDFCPHPSLSLSHSSLYPGRWPLGRLLAVELAFPGPPGEFRRPEAPRRNNRSPRWPPPCWHRWPNCHHRARRGCMGHYAAALAAVDCVADQSRCFQQAGTLIVWHRQDAAEAQRTRCWKPTSKPPGTAATAKLDSAALAAEPTLAERFNHGLYLPGEASWTTASCREQPARRNDTAGCADAGMHPTPEAFATARQGNPTGCWTAGPGRPPVTGKRPARCAGRGGTPVRTRCHPQQRPTRLGAPPLPIYLAPQQDHVFVIGATEIRESDDPSPASADRRWSC